MEMFRKAFNLPANDPQVVITDVDPGILGGDESAEVSLDSEWSGAVAPGATIKVVISSTTLTTNGVFLSASYIVDNNVADIMTVSFEACESKLTPEQNAFLNATWQQAAAEGISVFVASGDQGAADCDVKGLSASPASGGLAVNGLASTPFNTAVGGTEFNENGNQATYWGAEDVFGQAFLDRAQRQSTDFHLDTWNTVSNSEGRSLHRRDGIQAVIAGIALCNRALAP